uniref:Uncharacterized protein n=1 Tax=Panagrolaimus sp. PS1159 TaxID=55785 RepID=A0AC35G855_9BILA
MDLDADTVIASWGNPSSSSSSDYPNSQTGLFADTSSSNGGVSVAEFFDQFRATPSYSNRNYNYNYPSYNYADRAPIYGNAGYTSGQVNSVLAVHAYTYNTYICDTRANRYG